MKMQVGGGAFITLLGSRLVINSSVKMSTRLKRIATVPREARSYRGKSLLFMQHPVIRQFTGLPSIKLQ